MQKVVLVLMVVLGVVAALLLGGAGMMGYGFGMDSTMMQGIGAAFSPVFLYVVIGLGCLLVFWLSRPRAHAHVTAAASNSTSALEVSKMRYARGEITKEQYDVIKHDLGK